ncbi:MAG TPA: peptidoglycan N-acetylmuramoylhydrolase [Arcobacter sp.]|nr:peptidoglycan N-acetylmuramoylhydrolase [Arcobacter sp.]HIP55827.1 peptidoglycan N-acetylmuramoylhydrolase [Arcobacter sp.]
MKSIYLSIIIVLVFSACQEKKVEKLEHISKANLQKIEFKELVGFKEDNLNLALEVFQKSCKSRRVNKELKNVCKKAIKATNGKLFFTTHFIAYKLLNKKNSDQGLITGYYEPILQGSFTKTNIYKYPIYKTPKDLISVRLNSLYPKLKNYTLRGKVVGNKLVPYETREELEKQKDKLEALLYVDSKVDRFFLEIQGSGKVRLENNEIVNVAYSNQNGRKYFAVGRQLIKDGSIKRKDMSLQAIKKWCDENPSKVDKLFNLNESTVFFTLSKKSATGSLGVPLVAKRNIAVDKKYIPLGFPVFLNTKNPIDNSDINILVTAADTGGAIKGDIRADLFWGNTKEAKLGAGKMAQRGLLTILIPKNSTKYKGLFDYNVPINSNHLIQYSYSK